MIDRIQAVTGAFGYSGKYITRKLIEEEVSVRTFTNSPNRQNPFENKIKVYPYNFENYPKLVASLIGVEVFYNTYWVRFNHSDFSHSSAVSNTLLLFRACREAGVKRIVHVSITNPSEESELEYFSGKAKLEKALIDSGIGYSILRPAVLFGNEDILINNIAWMLRHLPVFGVFGDGEYKLQPIHVQDFAELAVQEGKGSENKIIDAIGPETFSYRELVKTISEIIGVRRATVSVPPSVGYACGVIAGWMLGDKVITKDEIKGLMKGLLATNSNPVGTTALTEWAKRNSNQLGRHYASELARRNDRTKAYENL